MGVARQVLQRDLGTAERRLGVDHPRFPFGRGQQASEVALLSQVLELTVKRQLALQECLPQQVQNFSSKNMTQHTDGQEEIVVPYKRTQREPSKAMPPPGTTQCRCG